MDTPPSFPRPQPEPVAAPVRPKVHKLFYLGKIEPLIQLGGINMVFSALTLGGFYFKAITSIMGYLVRHLALSKQIRLSYSGQALPLFKAIAPALAGLLITAVLLQWAVMTQNFAVFFVVLPFVYAAIQLGIFLAQKYHLSHIKIRDTAVTYAASPMAFIKTVMMRTGLNLVTFGYAIPQSDLEKWKVFVGGLQVGSETFSFDGDVKTLRWIHTVSFYLPCLLAVMFLLLSAQAGIDAASGEAAERVATGKTLLLGLFYVALLGGFIGRGWYQAALRAECLRGLKLGRLRFRSTVGGKELFRQRAINTALMVGTLGLAYPVILHRSLDVWSKTSIIGGDIETVLTPSVHSGVPL